MPKPLPVTFVAGSSGPWRVARVHAVVGETLAGAGRLAVREGEAGAVPADAAWVLRGVAGSARYAHRDEVRTMGARQEGLERPGATCAALIPVRKSEAWWSLAQDERRAIFEEQSRHIAIGLDYLPAVARRLHQCRDLGEPFDFLTWFEYAPEHAPAFEEMVGRLRATAEWGYVEREVDVRLIRDPAP